jgi:DNA-directed RNA polymerase specialized sigma24 family protein
MAEHSTNHVPESLESEIAAYRRLAFAIAYRMLGSVDIVQEAFLRLHRRVRKAWSSTTARERFGVGPR